MDQVFAFLSGTGVAGAVLAYHLWKLEPRLRAIEDSISRQGKIDLLRMATSPHVAPELKEVAKTMIAEIDRALETK